MTERLLHFIWQHQYFNSNELYTLDGEELQIIYPGHYNNNQGPDFTDARIRIGNTILAGTVELHLLTSHWKQHGHSNDANYGNVILHVVWENNHSPAAPAIPLLVLQNRVPGILISQYSEWLDNTSSIPCGKQWMVNIFPDWQNWKGMLLKERQLRKETRVKHFLDECQQHWEEAFWWLLARHLGDPVNAEAFEAIARSLPLKLLIRHRNQIHQLEALLLGQAGLLKGAFRESYPTLLQKEYFFLSKKYKLSPCPWPVLFLRMRPGNFPTIRLAQLAMLLHSAGSLFTLLRDCQTVNDIKKLLEVSANDYWHYHFQFDDPGKFSVKRLGNEMTRSIIVNVICPIVICYGKQANDPILIKKAMNWMEELPPEKNRIIKKFGQIGNPPETAGDTQALLELRKNYCDKLRCLDCAIGNYWLYSGFAMNPIMKNDF